VSFPSWPLLLLTCGSEKSNLPPVPAARSTSESLKFWMIIGLPHSLPGQCFARNPVVLDWVQAAIRAVKSLVRPALHLQLDNFRANKLRSTGHGLFESSPDKPSGAHELNECSFMNDVNPTYLRTKRVTLLCHG
jgi:hypothetical protein